MSLATIHTRAAFSIDAPAVTIEVHLSNGLPALSIVGLPETTVRESKDRVRAALQNCGFTFPAKRITINLAPTDLPKEGGRFDLPIAIGILLASQQLGEANATEYEIAGELRPIKGVLPLAIQAQKAGRKIIIPGGNSAEAVLVDDATVYAANHLMEVVNHLAGVTPLTRSSVDITMLAPEKPIVGNDMADVIGQQHARRALELAAAGGHNLLLYGPPGTGKTMLASRLPSIMPPLSMQEALESAAVASISRQGFQLDQWRIRPFRAPHHTASSVALVGGGNPPRPGEVSMAHTGVLFLDELPEFDRKVLEVLREPLEAGQISIARASHQADFPAKLQLVAAMNPCPCGYLGHPNGKCNCTPIQIGRYRNRISGPLLDRIDMHIEVPPIDHQQLHNHKPDQQPENSQTIRERVSSCRALQLARQQKPNSHLSPREIQRYCALDKQGQKMMVQISEKLGLSTRAHHRIQKVSRTIADLEQCEQIGNHHLAEAIGYRNFDRQV